jgi:glycosyltransferase involved in cell wall biosynthesis
MKINFILPPSHNITGGPLAILEYANRLIDKGHDVSVTTYPDIWWAGDSPFPWFEFKGKIHYKQLRRSKRKSYRIPLLPKLFHLVKCVFRANKIARSISAVNTCTADDASKLFIQYMIDLGGIPALADLIQNVGDNKDRFKGTGVESILQDMLLMQYVLESIPDCDLNIATLWVTAFPAFLSRKGKPVYFMQHYEEVFYPNNLSLQKLGARLSYGLPMYKVANSSWLKKIILEKCGQDIPFSNNAIVVSDFGPQEKLSEKDGIIRVVTYSRPEDWKGFGDAVAAMKVIRKKFGDRVEWRVFGYRNPILPPDNEYFPYTYHPKLSFKELANLYATSDIALCLSWYESFPLPPLEAMASGTAVITTAMGTEDYAFDGKNALVVKSRDISAMTDSIEKLITDGVLRKKLAAEGVKTAESFSWDNAVDAREKILLDIHHNRTSYDINKASFLGFEDAHGIPFEYAPDDLKVENHTLIKTKNDPRVFLVENNCKRHIDSPQVINDLGLKWEDLKEIDSLTLFRLPTGSPVYKASDIQSEK